MNERNIIITKKEDDEGEEKEEGRKRKHDEDISICNIKHFVYVYVVKIIMPSDRICITPHNNLQALGLDQSFISFRFPSLMYKKKILN